MLCLAEPGKENQRGEDGGLDEDRENERTAPLPAFATALLRIAFDQTSAERPQISFNDFFRKASRIERHHAPPRFLLRGSNPLAGAQKRFLVRFRGALAFLKFQVF
jgi:hypothetical protein